MLVELIAKNAGASQQQHFPYRPTPSKVGRCIRALVYDAMGVPPDTFPDRAILIFEDGNWHEELIKDHIRKTVFKLDEWKGKKQRIEIAVINGRVMDGEIDGLLTDPLDEIYLLEIKSINHFGFERLETEALDDHRRQINLYLHGLIKAGLSIFKALILYKNKNTAAMKEFVIEYDEALALKDIAMFEQVEKLAKERTLPLRPYWFTDWQCKYCRWSNGCWSTYVEEVNKMQKGFELESDYADTARYYKELGGQESEIKKQRAELYDKLKAGLFAVEAKEAVAGEYGIKLSAFERDVIDKSKVPPEAISKAPQERLTVALLKVNPKGKEKTNAKVHNNQTT